MQSRRWSLIESIANMAVGFLISMGLNSYFFHLHGVQISASGNAAMVATFTVVSIVRSYWLRRVFNRIGEKANG